MIHEKSITKHLDNLPLLHENMSVFEEMNCLKTSGNDGLPVKIFNVLNKEAKFCLVLRMTKNCCLFFEMQQLLLYALSL